MGTRPEEIVMFKSRKELWVLLVAISPMYMRGTTCQKSTRAFTSEKDQTESSILQPPVPCSHHEARRSEDRHVVDTPLRCCGRKKENVVGQKCEPADREGFAAITKTGLGYFLREQFEGLRVEHVGCVIAKALANDGGYLVWRVRLERNGYGRHFLVGEIG